MDYNTQRDKLLMSEYGRHVQDMVNYVKNIPDKEKRNEQIQAVVAVMGTLNPQLRDINDFKHKLWDHVQVIADFDIDIDSPYPTPTKETLNTKPNVIPIQKSPIKISHYGRNIQNMIDVIAEKEEGETKVYMIKTLASYMMQQYLIWNKDTVEEQIIFRDIVALSNGKITIPEDMHLSSAHSDGGSHQRTNNHSRPNNNYRNNDKNKQKNKRWKNSK